MKIDSYGRVFRTETELIDLLYSNPDLDFSKIIIPNSELYDAAAKACGVQTSLPLSEITLDLEQFDKINQNDWLMPEEYKNLDIDLFLINEAPTEEAIMRVAHELTLFREKNMIDLLRWCKYFVDTCRANNIVWGVGRGSSVASYVLYLIGIHKIDSIKYNLDFAEFMR